LTARTLYCAFTLSLCAAGWAQTNTLRVEVGFDRSTTGTAYAADQAVRNFTKRVADLTRKSRTKSWRGNAPLTVPARVELTQFGQPIRSRTTPGKRFGDITLQFASTGDRAFPETYRQSLEAVYAAAKPTMDAIFGRALEGGTVVVSNYNNDIFDREAVAGGYYVPDNGSGQREIRFPIYNSSDAAAVNFIHCLLLAYQGTTPYAFDAFQEGLVRAVTAQVARTSGAIPGGSSPQVEQTLFNTYEVEGLYDWYNQRALGGSKFIAPNLLKPALPDGGSYGGLYLLRYRMAGAAWQKVLAEYPSFVRELNARLEAQPALAGNVPGLIDAGQQILNALRPGDPTVEGSTFADWVARQHILETRDTNGLKLLVQTTPIVSGLGGSDFGVFNIEANYFSRTANGDETLLSATAFPIFWDPTFSFRLFPSAQDERMDIAAAYGSVGPNFANEFGGQPYRVAVDLPVADQVARAYLPAGAIATPSNQSAPNNFYGTLTGVPAGTYSVRVLLGATEIATTPVRNFAFGARIADDRFTRTRALTIQVLNGTGGTVLSRRVNKGPGDLALDLRVGENQTFALPAGLPAGLSAIGLPFDPYSASAEDLVSLPADQMLFARYNPARLRYELYPDTEAPTGGHAYFTRRDAAIGKSYAGRANVAPTSVALRPGWNMVATPFAATTPTTAIQVIRGSENPQTFASSLGTTLGLEFFSFSPGPADPVTGVPENGTFTPATSFLPGRAYFVRCLAPEGATLFFTPTSTSPARAAVSSATLPNLRWSTTITASGKSVSASAIVGMSNTATRSFDPREDSTLPPGVGGFQIKAVNGQEFRREVRGYAFNDAYSLRLEGLRAGQTYTLTFQQNRFPSPTLSLTHDSRRRTVTIGTYGTYSFRADRATETFTLGVRGVR